jgi:hypothetical protein
MPEWYRVQDVARVLRERECDAMGTKLSGDCWTVHQLMRFALVFSATLIAMTLGLCARSEAAVQSNTECLTPSELNSLRQRNEAALKGG